MYGPFRPCDLVANEFRSARIGGFLLAHDKVFLGGRWNTIVPNPAKDALVQFNPQGIPKLVQPWAPDEQCLMIAPGRLEISLAGTRSQADDGCIGIDISGDLALTVRKGDTTDWAFLQLDGTVRDRAPPGFVWFKTWRLELVLGDGHCRIPLGEHQ